VWHSVLTTLVFYYGVMHPVARIIEVVNETVLRNDCLRCYIHIFTATCFGLYDDHPQTNRTNYLKKLLLLQRVR
jgi:hypothetical protein